MKVMDWVLPKAARRTRTGLKLGLKTEKKNLFTLLLCLIFVLVYST
jgi:hypothetical protein